MPTNLMRLQMDFIDGFQYEGYWSSAEDKDSGVWEQHFGNSTSRGTSYKHRERTVRAVRVF